MRVAAIDIGTNSVHMVVVEADGRPRFEVIEREKSMIKLGAGLFRTRRLSERAFSDGLETMRRFVKLAEGNGVDELLAVATSATREAENGGAFLHAIFRETGVMPRVVSGTEEGRLIFLAVRHALDLGQERALVFDIGGGSVEAVIGDQREVLLSESLRLGVQRLLDRHKSADPLTPKQFAELQGYIEGAASEVIERARELGFSRIIGTSGTIRTLGEAAHLMTGGNPWRSVNAQVARRKDLKDLSKKLVELPADKRGKLVGVPEARADAIHLGAVLLVQLLEMAGADEITLCDASLREGVILDYLDRHGPSTHHPHVVDVRRRSVLELARKYDRDDPRERHVASLAISLFDQTHDLHGLGARERELLEHAAMLHGIGQHIRHGGRHRHAQYIIMHSNLRGFNDEEIELLGLVVRYHRRAAPTNRQREMAGLNKKEREIVRVLSAMLRLAVALDRGRSQVVKRVRVERNDSGLKLLVSGSGDLELELYAARRRVDPLRRALGLSIAVEQDG
jgi:exopolyphosphatase/guanosine-5'-triphosphate,3'-diphosphate pyrophosphatase